MSCVCVCVCQLCGSHAYRTPSEHTWPRVGSVKFKSAGTAQPFYILYPDDIHYPAVDVIVYQEMLCNIRHIIHQCSGIGVYKMLVTGSIDKMVYGMRNLRVVLFHTTYVLYQIQSALGRLDCSNVITSRTKLDRIGNSVWI